MHTCNYMYSTITCQHTHSLPNLFLQLNASMMHTHTPYITPYHCVLPVFLVGRLGVQVPSQPRATDCPCLSIQSVHICNKAMVTFPDPSPTQTMTMHHLQYTKVVKTKVPTHTDEQLMQRPTHTVTQISYYNLFLHHSQPSKPHTSQCVICWKK